MLSSGSDVIRQLIVAKTSERKLGCLDTCQRLAEGQFLAITDAPALLLTEVCWRKVGRTELVEIF